MNRLILKTDSEREIVIAETRLGPALLALVLIALIAAVRIFFPGSLIAPAVLSAFPLGFPMGSRLATEKAADYAQRLGVEAVDRTTSSLSAHN